MYRNTYLELYKSSASHEQNPTILLTHFSQIYNTLGCVLQDLEYHIGRLQLQTSKLQPVEEASRESEQSKAVYLPRPKKPEREVVKIEDSLDDQPIRKNRVSDKQTREAHNSSRKPQSSVEAVKVEANEARAELTRPAKLNEKQPREVEPERRQEYRVVERVRAAEKRPSDSFDELFGGVQEQRMDPHRSRNFEANLLPIPQNPSENEVPNTYDDFMQRIFKETESRRSK